MAEPVTLRKGVLGFPQTFSASLGLVVCSTTLMMVCYGFAEAGPAFFLSMIGAGIIVGLFALSVSELCVAMPRASSMGEYARAALGPIGGIWQGIMYFMVFTGLAAEAMVIGMVTNMFWPAIAWQWYSLIFIAIFYVLNLLGIVIVGWTQVVLTVLFTAIYGIGAIIQFGGGGIEPFSLATFGGFAPAGWGAVGVWLIVGIWLYAMVEAPIPLVEEIKNPAKNIPKGMFAALGVIFALQALIGFAVAGTLGSEATFATSYPHVMAGKAFFGTAGFILFGVATIAATFSTFNAVMASTSRVLYGLGADGYLGKVIGYLHPRFRTPWVTLSMVFVFTVILTIVAKSPLWVAAMDSFLFTITYLAVCVYTIVLRHRRPDMERPFYAGGPFKAPIGPILGIIGTGVVMYYTIYFDISVLYVGGSIAAGVALISWIIWQFYAKNRVVRE
jgi:ethanolamine permease